MSLNESIALLTPSDFFDYIGADKKDDKIPSDEVAKLINSVSQSFINETGRKFIAPGSIIVEKFDGNGRDSYRVKNGNFLADSTPRLYYTSDGTTYTEALSPSFEIEYVHESGEIFINNGLSFSKGRRNWRIDYEYGYTIATLPDDIAFMARKLVHRMYKAVEIEGVTSKSFNDSTISNNLNKLMSQEIMDVLQTYKVSLL